MLKAVLYARVSTRDGRQDTDNQLAQLREFAERQGWELVNEYTDEASGSSKDRTRFQEMFRDAAKRRFDVLLFWSLDRLSREGVLPTLQYLTRLSDYGIAWRSFTEQYLDSTGVFKDAVIGILAAIAKQEKVRISERTRAGLERARRQGRVLGRPRSTANREQIRNLRSQGLSWEKIAAQTGVPRATCQRVACG